MRSLNLTSDQVEAILRERGEVRIIDLMREMYPGIPQYALTGQRDSIARAVQRLVKWGMAERVDNGYHDVRWRWVG